MCALDHRREARRLELLIDTAGLLGDVMEDLLTHHYFDDKSVDRRKNEHCDFVNASALMRRS